MTRRHPHRCPCHRRAGAQRPRTAGLSRVPGRLQRADPRGPTHWTCASSRPGAPRTYCSYSRPAAPTSSASARTWRAADRARATVTRRLCTVAGFYKYAVEKELLDHSPAAHPADPQGPHPSSPGSAPCIAPRRRACTAVDTCHIGTEPAHCWPKPGIGPGGLEARYLNVLADRNTKATIRLDLREPLAHIRLDRNGQSLTVRTASPTRTGIPESA